MRSCKTKSDMPGLKHSERNTERGWTGGGGTGKNQKIMQDQGRQQPELSAQHEEVPPAEHQKAAKRWDTRKRWAGFASTQGTGMNQ